jgi:hypothetical protein
MNKSDTSTTVQAGTTLQPSPMAQNRSTVQTEPTVHTRPTVQTRSTVHINNPTVQAGPNGQTSPTVLTIPTVQTNTVSVPTSNPFSLLAAKNTVSSNSETSSLAAVDSSTNTATITNNLQRKSVMQNESTPLEMKLSQKKKQSDVSLGQKEISAYDTWASNQTEAAIQAKEKNPALQLEKNNPEPRLLGFNKQGKVRRGLNKQEQEENIAVIGLKDILSAEDRKQPTEDLANIEGK